MLGNKTLNDYDVTNLLLDQIDVQFILKKVCSLNYVNIVYPVMCLLGFTEDIQLMIIMLFKSPANYINL